MDATTDPTTPQPSIPCDVLIVGAGASGTLLAAQLAQQASHLRVLLLDGDRSAGRGAAYRTACDEHLLNVPARGMSGLASEPNHFHQWLERRMPGASAGTFASRSMYGDYLHDLLTQAVAQGRVEVKPDWAVAAERCSAAGSSSHWQVKLRSGATVDAAAVVLAWGNFTPAPPACCQTLESPLFINDPWRSDLAQGLSDGMARREPVLMLGTGLTMFDVALALRQRGYRGPLHALSRHGRLPHAHAVYPARELCSAPPLGSPRAVLSWLRKEARVAEQAGGNWRAVIDALRPYNQKLWQSWGHDQRLAFMRHMRTVWDIHRHRAAPEIAQRIGAMVRSGGLTIHSGRLASISPANDAADQGPALRVEWRMASGEMKQGRYARVINCTGLASDYRCIDHELITQLRDAGWLTPDALGMGMETDAHGQLTQADGTASPGLYTLGPPRRAQLWESIAVPELRVQAAALAQHLFSQVVPGMSVRLAALHC